MGVEVFSEMSIIFSILSLVCLVMAFYSMATDNPIGALISCFFMYLLMKGATDSMEEDRIARQAQARKDQWSEATDKMNKLLKEQK